jgi:hypothetical protein
MILVRDVAPDPFCSDEDGLGLDVVFLMEDKDSRVCAFDFMFLLCLR